MSVQGGMARLDKNGNLESATLKNVRMGRTNASFIVTPVSPGRTRLVVSGDVVDLSGYWSQKKEPTAKDATLPPRYDISLRTSKLYLDPELPFTGGAGRYFRTGAANSGDGYQRGSRGRQADGRAETDRGGPADAGRYG
jgi:hypothetical protein